MDYGTFNHTVLYVANAIQELPSVMVIEILSFAMMHVNRVFFKEQFRCSSENMHKCFKFHPKAANLRLRCSVYTIKSNSMELDVQHRAHLSSVGFTPMGYIDFLCIRILFLKTKVT